MRNITMTFHYLFRSVLLASFSFLIVRLVQVGSLHYYIAPRTELYVKLAALVLFLLAVCLAYISLRGLNTHTNCGCNHKPSPSISKSILMYSLFVLPLGLGFFTPDTLLASNITSMKGINLSTNNYMKTNMPAEEIIDEHAPAEPSSLHSLFPYDEYTELHAKLGMKLYTQDVISIQDIGFMEVLTTLDIYRENFIGKTVEISGFVYREDDMEPHQFVVSRLAMQCCSADTEPYGILATYSNGKELAKDSWIRATGVLGLTSYNDIEIMELTINRIETITQPETPYVYPDDDYFEQLLADE